MLKQRILTALVLLPVALAGFLLLDGGGFALFIGVVIVLGAWEWAHLAGFDRQFERCLFAAATALVLFCLFKLPVLAEAVLILGLIWWLLAAVLVMTYPRSVSYWGGRWRRLLIGWLILIPAWQGLVVLKQWPQGIGLIIMVMALVWAADIGAYFAGRAFGKRKLAAAVSPGKSWEGAIGGMCASLLIVIGCGFFQDWTASRMLMAVIGAVWVVAISIIGDLTESMFKRQAGVKDSSRLLPGHGGILDRIDSLTAAVPVFTALLWLVGWNAS